MNLAQIDLRLLLVFDAVMTERNVSKAGHRIGLSQPAMSNALNRLRHLLNDQLFLRGAGGMRPTQRALDLATPVRQSLHQLQQALEPSTFDARQVNWTFTLAVSDHASVVILPQLIGRVFNSAPNVNLRIQAKINVSVAELLDTNEIDMAIGVIPDLPKRFSRQTLFEDVYVCLMRRDHPLAGDSISEQAFLAADHITVQTSDEPMAHVDRLLRKRGLKRRIAANVSQFLAVPSIIRDSDALLVQFRRAAEALPNLDQFHICQLPFLVEPAQIVMVWNRARTHQPANEWLRREVVEVCRLATASQDAVVD